MIFSFSRMLPLSILWVVYSGSVFAAPDKDGTLDEYLSLSLAELGQIKVSIATGNETTFDKVPAAASFISAAEIEAMGAKTLDDVLETVPGFHVSLSSINRLESVYSIRGIHTGFSPQVLFLLDGVPLQSVQGAHPTLFRLPVAGIERVEVIRGPGSAVYGADAFSGVINVITKNAHTMNGVQAGVRSGSFNSHDIWVQGATEWQGWGIAFSTNYQDSDGDNQRRIPSDFQSSLDSIFNTNASQAPGSLSTRYQVLDNHLAFNNEQFDINIWNWLSTDAGIGAGGAQALDESGSDDSSIWLADVTYHLPQWSDQWENNIRVSYQYYKIQAHFNLLPAGTVVPIGSDGNLNFSPSSGIVAFPDGLLGNPEGVLRDGIADLVSTFSGWDNHRIRIAAGAQHLSMNTWETKNYGPGVLDGSESVRDGTLVDVSNTSYIYMPFESRSIYYFSLQDEWQLRNDLALTSGVRYDDYSDFGSTTNPRLSLVWSANENLTTKLLYGSAFRAPSFQELYFQNNPVTLGNPTLNPERIDTLEFATNYRITSGVQSTLTLFKYRARDLIEFTPDLGASTKTAQNARDQNGKGFEWELNWKPTTQLHLSASYSWQDAQDDQTDADIPDAPGKQIKVNANWEFSTNWFLNSQAYWVGDRERAITDVRSKVDNYTLANFTLHRKNIVHNLDVSLAVRNAFNADAREPSSADETGSSIPNDYPLEHRSLWLELRYFLK